MGTVISSILQVTKLRVQGLSDFPKGTKLADGGPDRLAPEPLVSVTLLPLNHDSGLQGGEETEGFNDT